MIRGIGMGDMVVIVVSALPGELEFVDYRITGILEDILSTVGGLGKRALIFAITNIDHPSIPNPEERYEEVTTILDDHLYRMKMGLEGMGIFVPVDPFSNRNIVKKDGGYPFYTGGSLIEVMIDRMREFNYDRFERDRYLYLPIDAVDKTPGRTYSAVSRVRHGEVSSGERLRRCPESSHYTVQDIFIGGKATSKVNSKQIASFTFKWLKIHEDDVWNGSYFTNEQHCISIDSIKVKIKLLRTLDGERTTGWTPTAYFNSFSTPINLIGVDEKEGVEESSMNRQF